MKVIVTKNHQESCRLTAELIAGIVNENKGGILGLATGGTVEPVYAELAEMHRSGKLSFKNTRTVNLDEYLGLSPEHDQSYRYFMNKHLFNKIDIDKANTYVPVGSNPADAELAAFHKKLADNPRDFQLLGVGPNGHIAFNEPAPSLHANAHIVEIAAATVKANSRYFASEAEVPKKAFTQGMGDILKAKVLALLATGPAKAEAMKALLMNDEISPGCPCTFLKAHPQAYIYIDKELADLIGYKG